MTADLVTEQFTAQATAFEFSGKGMSATANLRRGWWEIEIILDMGNRYRLDCATEDGAVSAVRAIFDQAPGLLEAAEALSRQTADAYGKIGDLVRSFAVRPGSVVVAC